MKVLRLLSLSVLMAMLATLWGCTGDHSDSNQIAAKRSKTAAKSLVDDKQITSDSLDQGQPATAYDNVNNQFLIVWTHTNQDGTTDIKGQIYQGSGGSIPAPGTPSALTAIGAILDINSGSGSQSQPKVAFDLNTQKYLVIWTDARTAGTALGGEIAGSIISAQFVSAAGVLQTRAGAAGVDFFDISTQNANNISQSNPDLVYDAPRNKFIAAWLDKTNADATHVSPPLTGTTCSNSTTVTYVPLPSSDTNMIRTIEISPTNGATSNPLDVSKLLFKSTFADSGTSLSAVWSVQTKESSPRLVVTPSGEYFTAWSGINQTVTLTLPYKTGNPVAPAVTAPCIYGAAVFATSEADAEVKVKIRKDSGFGLYQDFSFGNKATSPAVAVDSDSGLLLLAWEEQQGTAKSIMGQLINISNLTNNGNTITISSGNGDRSAPAASFDNANSRFLVVWEDARNQSANISNMDLYAQFIDPQGNLSGGNSIVSVAPGNQLAPAVVFGGPLFRQFMVIWKDGRASSNSDIFGQLLEFSVSPQLTIIGTDGITPILNGAYNFGTVIVGQTAQANLKLRNDGNAPLNIFDHNSLLSPYSFVTQFPQQVTIAPGTTFDVTIGFSPTASGSYAGSNFLLDINSDGGNSKLYLSGSGSGGAALQISTTTVPDGQPSVAYSTTLQATGGAYPYTWGLTGNPVWLNIDTNTGVLSGTPPLSGSYTFTVNLTDNNFPNKNTASQNITLTIGAISITTPSLADASTGVLYSQTLAQVGATAPLSWTLANGTLLPDGLTLDSLGGTISGTPTKRGTFNFTVKLTGANGSTTRDYSIKVDTPLSIDAATLSTGSTQQSYLQTLTAKGGRAPYSWALDLTAGALPDGLKLAPNSGVISGTPTANGIFDFNVKVTDADQKTATQQFSISIYNQMTSASIVDFGTVATGKTVSKTLVVTNTTGVTFNITGITLPSAAGSPFTIKDVAGNSFTGPVTLIPNASYTFIIDMNAATANSYSGNFGIVTNSPAGALNVLVTGIAVNPTIIITPATKKIDYTNIQTNQQAMQIIEIDNTGIIPITITGFSLPSLSNSPFTLQDSQTTISTSSSFVIPQGQKKQFQLVFAPITSGTFTTSISIYFEHLGPSAPEMFAVTGTTVPSSMSLNTQTLNMGSVKVKSSRTDTINVTNDGSQDYKAQISTSTAPFGSEWTTQLQWTTTLRDKYISIASNKSESITVSFTPTQRGDFTQNLNITSDTGISKTVVLQGKGVAPIMRSLSNDLIDFGTLPVGTNQVKTITLYNDGDGQMDITSLGTLPKGYSFVSTPTGIPPNSSVDISIKFAPIDAGLFSGSFVVQTDGGNQTINLTGSGTGPKLNLSLSQLDFGSVTTGQTNTLKLTLTNGGSATLSITGISDPVNTLFKLIYTGAAPSVAVPVKLLPSTSFDVYVQFAPTAAGTFLGSFNITSDAINVVGPQAVNLQGFGVPLTIGTTPAALTFPSTAVNASQTMNLDVSNNGTAPVTLTSIDSPGAPFTIDTPPALPLTINPGSSKTLKVKFAPTTSGTFSSSIGLLFDSSTSPYIVNLSGTGGSQTLSGNLSFILNNATVTTSSFGSVYRGSVKTYTFTLKNVGSGPLNIDTITPPTEGFSTNLFAPIALAAGATKDFTVTFNPTIAKSYSGTLTLKDTASLITSQLSLNGTGTSVFVQVKNSLGTVLTDVTYGTLSQQELAATTGTKPAGVSTASSGVQFRVGSLSTVTPESVDVTVTFESLPSNPVFYKVVNGQWIVLANATLTGNTLTFSLTDNGPLDSDATLGSIIDPIVVTSAGGSTGGTASGDMTAPPSSSGGKSGCFIATAAYGSYLDPHVMVLRHFRDNVLLQSKPGTAFVEFYYKHSPPIADFIAQHDSLRTIIRLALTPLIFVVKYPLVVAMLFAFAMIWFLKRRSYVKEFETAQQH